MVLKNYKSHSIEGHGAYPGEVGSEELKFAQERVKLRWNFQSWGEGQNWKKNIP